MTLYQSTELMDTKMKAREYLGYLEYLEYVASNPLERRAMEIAKDHLGSSFDIGRSNGFRTWQQQTQTQQQQQQTQSQKKPN